MFTVEVSRIPDAWCNTCLKISSFCKVFREHPDILANWMVCTVRSTKTAGVLKRYSTWESLSCTLPRELFDQLRNRLHHILSCLDYVCFYFKVAWMRSPLRFDFFIVSSTFCLCEKGKQGFLNFHSPSMFLDHFIYNDIKTTLHLSHPLCTQNGLLCWDKTDCPYKALNQIYMLQ